MNESSIKELEDKKFRLKAGIFLSSVAGVAALVGFGKTLASAKKHDPTFFSKGMTGELGMADTGANLAMRALGWGTLFAFMGTGAMCYGIWKLSGAKDMKEFRHKCGTILPKIPKPENPTGRTEFEGLTDLMTYLSNMKK
ncbi:unnamed protein product [Diamesa tonsa]